MKLKKIFINSSILSLSSTSSLTLSSFSVYASNILSDRYSVDFSKDDIFKFINLDFYEASKIAY